MNKKFLYFGIAFSALFASCKKDDAPMPAKNGSNNLNKATRITGAQTIQNAAFYNAYSFNTGNLSLAPSAYSPADYDYADVLPYCLGGTCGIYTTYQVYIRQNNTSNFEGPYNVIELARPSTYYYPGQNIYVLRAYIPKIKQLIGVQGTTPLYGIASHNGLYYVCLVPPGTMPTLNPANPTEQLLINFGDNNF